MEVIAMSLKVPLDIPPPFESYLEVESSENFLQNFGFWQSAIWGVVTIIQGRFQGDVKVLYMANIEVSKLLGE